MTAKYELKKGGYGKYQVWYFVFKTDDNRILVTSELYSSRSAALADIAVLRLEASSRILNDLSEYKRS